MHPLLFFLKKFAFSFLSFLAHKASFVSTFFTRHSFLQTMKLAIFSLVAIALPLFVIDSATQIQAAIIYIPDFPCAKEIYSFSYSKACSCSDGPESSISTAVITPTSKSHSISSSHSTSSSHPTGSPYSTSSKVSTLGPISTSIRFTTTRNPKPTTTSSSSAKSYTSTSSSISIISTSPIGTVVPTYTGSAPISKPGHEQLNYLIISYQYTRCPFFCGIFV